MTCPKSHGQDGASKVVSSDGPHSSPELFPLQQATCSMRSPSRIVKYKGHGPVDCSTLRSDFRPPFLGLFTLACPSALPLAGWPLQEAFAGLGQPESWPWTGGETETKTESGGSSAQDPVSGPAADPAWVSGGGPQRTPLENSLPCIITSGFLGQTIITLGSRLARVMGWLY